MGRSNKRDQKRMRRKERKRLGRVTNGNGSPNSSLQDPEEWEKGAA